MYLKFLIYPGRQAPVMGPATKYVISGPTTGTVGVTTSTFTLTTDGITRNNVTVTLSDSGHSGTFSPSSSVVIPAGAFSSVTFTYTPAQAGTYNVGGVSNTGSLSDASGSLSFTTSAATVNFGWFPDFNQPVRIKPLLRGSFLDSVASPEQDLLGKWFTGLAQPIFLPRPVHNFSLTTTLDAFPRPPAAPSLDGWWKDFSLPPKAKPGLSAAQQLPQVKNYNPLPTAAPNFGYFSNFNNPPAILVKPALKTAVAVTSGSKQPEELPPPNPPPSTGQWSARPFTRGFTRPYSHKDNRNP